MSNNMPNASSHNNERSLAADVAGLHLKFPNQQKPLFEDMSLTIGKNENTLLLGPSGSGKSTLLKVLTGLIPEVIDVPLRRNKCSSLDNWGYVFQDPDSQFCMPYVDEEIAFVLENRAVPAEEIPGHITHYLNLVGLSFDENHRPIKSLSQGQKQRLALASSLALEPEILVLDEPTALLDPKGTEMIWEQVRQLGENKTLLIVEHKIEKMIDFIDRVLVLNGRGEFIIDESPKELARKHQKVLDQYGIWHAQSWSNYDRQSTDVKLSASPAETKSNQPLLSIDHLEGYRDDEKQVEVAEAHIQAGEWVAVTGPNGAGKSTLLLATMQLIKSEGSVYFCGEPLTNVEQVAADIGFVFQNPELQFIGQRVREEIAFTLQQQCPGLTANEINHKVDRTLDGYGLTNVQNQNPYQLSTGQQRRLSIASTTVKKRKLLLLDEPTFGQDAVNTFAILEQLENYRQAGAAILMVTHDRRITKRFATRRWNIEDGAITYDRPGPRIQHTKFKESHAI